MHRFKDARGVPEVADGGTVRGYASTFDRDPDSYGDVVAEGAFADTIARWGELKQKGVYLPLLYGHNTNDPEYNIGRVTDMGEDEKGWWVEGEFDDENPKAQYVRKLAKEGRLYQFSFAFDVLDEGEVELEDGRKANELRRLDVFEVSLVQIPANQHAQVIEVKGAGQKQGKRNSKSDEDTIRQAITLLQSLIDGGGEGGGDEEGQEGKAAAQAQGAPGEDLSAKAASLLESIETISKEA